MSYDLSLIDQKIAKQRRVVARAIITSSDKKQARAERNKLRSLYGEKTVIRIGELYRRQAQQFQPS